MTAWGTTGERQVVRRGDVPFLSLRGTSAEVREEVLASWEELVDTGTFIGGDPVARFEQEWADYCGTGDAVGVGNGTDALQLALRGLGIGPGDEVLVPANTFVATAEAVALAGARPRFVDVDADTLLVTPSAIEEAVTPATRAVVVVHLYGQMPDIEAILDVATRLGLVVVEDAAQAHGASWGDRRAGSFGAAGCFSFYPGKNLGAFGDAGAVVTSDPDLADRLRSVRDHGRSPGGHHRHDLLGTNSRLDAVQAVVLSAKLRRLDAWNRARQRLRAAYAEHLDDERARLVRELSGSRGVYHLAVARVDDRDRVRAQLAERGIATGLHYPTPCHLMAPYRGLADKVLRVAEAQAGQVISLPLYPHMGFDDVEYVASEVNAVAPRR